MLWLLQLLPGLFSTINGITSAISNEKIAALNATTQEEQISAAERVSTLEAQRDVLIADVGKSNLDVWIRAFIALGPATYISKYYFWDKVVGSFVGCSGVTAPGTCGSFNTDGISSDMVNVLMIVVGFYFLHTIGSSVSRAIKS